MLTWLLLVVIAAAFAQFLDTIVRVSVSVKRHVVGLTLSMLLFLYPVILK